LLNNPAGSMGGRRVRPNFCMANSESRSSMVVPGVITPEAGTASCWSCGTMRAVHFCKSCGKVQPAAPVDYFAFFGLPRKLNLDTSALEKDFYALSRRLHPDMSAQGE